MKRFKNNKVTEDTWCGMLIQPSEYYEIQSTELLKWQTDSKVLSDIGSGDGIINDGTSDITDVATAIDFLKDNQVKPVIVQSMSNQSPFASKTFGTKKLYKRVIGITHACSIGSNDIVYTITYPWVKITGVEIVSGELGDTVNLKILDSTVGVISGVPNYMLNQFGFNVNVAKDLYEHKSEFDADLYQTLQIKCEFNSISEKTIGINFILNEVKT